MDGETALSVKVTGRVQGVWFRGWTRATALDLGLRGWVRNEPDGSVSAVIAGDRAAVERMVAALHRGPEASRVISVKTEPAEAPEGPGFQVRR